MIDQQTAGLLLSTQARHAELTAHAAECRANAATELDTAAAAEQLEEARAAEARALAIREGRA